MKKIIILLFSVVFFNIATAQYATKSLKEDFDYMYNSSAFINGSYSLYINYEPSFFSRENPHPCERRDFLDNIGDGNSYLMRALLNMYEVTLDKDYLIKFIQQANRILEFRRDIIDPNTEGAEPRWDFDEQICENEGKIGKEQMYHDGLLLLPYAQFCYLILNKYPALQNVALPTASITGLSPIKNNNGGTVSVSTYGDVANYYKVQTILSLSFFIGAGYWGDDNRCFLKIPDPSLTNRNKPNDVNQTSAFASALYYMGMLGVTDYYNKAGIIAAHYFGTTINEFGNGTSTNYTTANPNCNGQANSCGSINILNIFTALNNNSYKWYGYGWREQPCSECSSIPQWLSGPDDYEDISHAVSSISFANTHVLSNYANLLVGNHFSSSFYQTLHNTFTKNIYGGTINNRVQINAGVDGDNTITYRNQLNGVNNDIVRKEALGWSWLYQWDSPFEGSVYDINMQLYNEMEADKLYTLKSLRGAQTLYGFTMLCKAQWEKECSNNTLYNRNMVYNQDFFAKNTLTVDPAKATYDISRIGAGAMQPGNDSYNEPIIQNPNFTIQPTVTSYMYAGEKIVLKPGFSAKAGCHFKASINPSNCSNGNKRDVNDESNNNNANETSSNTAQPLPIIENKTAETILSEATLVKVYPVPSSGIINVELSNLNLSQSEISIFNYLGEKIMCKNSGLAEKNTFDLSNNSDGWYCIKIMDFSNQKIYTHRINLVRYK
jgi:hypothetical protein